MQNFTKSKGETKMVNAEKEYKTGYSTSLIVEYAYRLQIPKADVGRRIIEYFIEHNDVEDLQA